MDSDERAKLDGRIGRFVFAMLHGVGFEERHGTLLEMAFQIANELTPEEAIAFTTQIHRYINVRTR